MTLFLFLMYFRLISDVYDLLLDLFFFFSSRRRHTRFDCDWSSDVCSSDLTVGSLVWFEAGRPKKAEYRRFRIRGAPQDDFAAVHEVVTRYLGRRISEAKGLPDLVVIDGGKGQLRAALDAPRALGPDKLPVVSLAKQPEAGVLAGH